MPRPQGRACTERTSNTLAHRTTQAHTTVQKHARAVKPADRAAAAEGLAAVVAAADEAIASVDAKDIAVKLAVKNADETPGGAAPPCARGCACAWLVL